MQQGFNLNAITNHDRNYWRVDWFGYLNYFDEKGVRRSEPLVDVFFITIQTPSEQCQLKI